jgi:hypothetical protein
MTNQTAIRTTAGSSLTIGGVRARPSFRARHKLVVPPTKPIVTSAVHRYFFRASAIGVSGSYWARHARLAATIGSGVSVRRPPVYRLALALLPRGRLQCARRARAQADNTLLNPEVHLYRNVYFRGALLPSIWLLPGLLTGCGNSLRYPARCRNKPFGQAVAGSMAAEPVPPVHGSHCLQPCSGWLAVHGCWLAAVL